MLKRKKEKIRDQFIKNDLVCEKVINVFDLISNKHISMDMQVHTGYLLHFP